MSVKVVMELPDWTKERHLRILAGIEEVAKKLKGKPWQVKDGRCNQCGVCCKNVPKNWRMGIDRETGWCQYLKYYANEYRCNTDRPFNCCVGDEAGEDHCPITWKVQGSLMARVKEKLTIFLETWKPIHLCWFYRRMGWQIPKYLIGGGSPFELPGSRIANATRTWQANEDTGVIDWDKANDFIIAAAVESGAHSAAAGTLQLRWRNKTDSGSFAVLSGSGELTWSATTDLVNGNALTSGEAGCTPSASESWDTDNGIEREGANDVATDLANNEWVEHHWAIDCSGAHAGDEYEFEIYDSTEGAAVGTCLATITMASAGIVVTPSPAACVLKSVIGAVVLGSLALTPSPATAIVKSVNPTVIKGSLSITPSPAACVVKSVSPTVTLGSVSMTPNPAKTICKSVAPTVILGSISITPSPVTVVVKSIDPTVIIGSGDLIVTPSPATMVVKSVAPTVILGSVVVSPSPVSCVIKSVNPVIVLGSVTVTPSSASTVLKSVDPTVIISGGGVSMGMIRRRRMQAMGLL